MRVLLLLLGVLFSMTAQALSYRNINMDSGEHAYRCTQSWSTGKGRKYTVEGLCVVKANKICFQSYDDIDDPNAGKLREVVFSDREEPGNTHRIYDIQKLFTRNFINPSDNNLYKLYFKESSPTLTATANCNLYY